MQHTFRNLTLVLLLLALCAAAIYPPKEKLRLGKDLAGGVSLVYTVELEEDDQPSVVDEMIPILQDRVNPSGLFEISMVRQGRDRLEISMPLPSAEVQALRDAYEAALRGFGDFELDIDAFERAMRMEGSARIAALDKLAAKSDAMAQILAPVREAAEAADAARRAFETARDSGVLTDEGRDELLNAAGETEAALDEARGAVLARSVTVERLRQALELSDRGPEIENEQGVRETLPSSRQLAMDNIRERLDGIRGAEESINGVIAAHEAYAAKRTGYDDPNDLIRVLKGSGVLEFRIAVAAGSVPAPEMERLREELQTRGPEYVQSDRFKWGVVNKAEDWYDSMADIRSMQADPAAYFQSRYNLIAASRDGQFYVLLHDEDGLRLTKAEGEWQLARSFQTSDQFGRSAIGFRMDARGASLLGDLTSANVNRPMAILLDGRVYTAPNINSRISSSGIIQGTFSPTELGYIIKTLNAGSLSAKLSEEPVSQQTLAPGLGLDNLKMGLTASWIALVAVCVFMIVYYFTSGFVATIALICNAVIILGIMSVARASFTLPGIAGIVLTFGMAVDANVLIYERIREELLAGNDVRAAVRIAYQKVFSTIMDANVTNLIVCFVLAYTATTEVKGFAITLGIGIVATLFSSLVITRIIFALLIDFVKVSKLRQLPMLVPILQKTLEPKIDFIKLRPLFLVISTGIVGLGVSMIVIQGADMLDTEFRGGTAITLQLKESDAGDGSKLTLTREEVENRVLSIADEADAGERAEILTEVRTAEIVAVNAEADGVTSSTFTVKSTIADDPATDENEQQVLVDALVSAFTDVIDSQPALDFAGAGSDTVREAPVYEVLYDTLGRNIDNDAISNNVAEYVGGVAVVIDGIDPPVTRRSLESRLAYMRNQPDHATALRRPHELIVLEGTDEAVTSAVLVAIDPAASFFDDAEAWRANVAQGEWDLVRDALTSSTTLAGVQSFSAVIAESFRAQAVVAVTLSFMLIVLYIWARFGSVRYSLAAVAALLHDVIAAIGLIALAEILYENVPFFVELGLQPYKINLALVAAILTIIGYSLNDTIVILDRIRENRGKLAYASRSVVNTSISQTISRTIITSGTTLVALIVLFLYGGDALSAFTYALICGVLVGTYSSIAVAAPLVFTSKIPPSKSYSSSVDEAGEGNELAPV
ncbi:MAG: protein translocase subunit SecD [Phycisphaerales bacterium]